MALQLSTCRAWTGPSMAKRTTSVRRTGSAELARETNLGSHLLVFNDDEVIQLLRAAVERESDQGVFARRHGVNRSNLNRMLKGKRPVASAVLNALGLRKVYAPK
jgi:hypothetical protein